MAGPAGRSARLGPWWTLVARVVVPSRMRGSGRRVLASAHRVPGVRGGTPSTTTARRYWDTGGGPWARGYRALPLNHLNDPGGRP